jgi:hypothetical protein
MLQEKEDLAVKTYLTINITTGKVIPSLFNILLNLPGIFTSSLGADVAMFGPCLRTSSLFRKFEG